MALYLSIYYPNMISFNARFWVCLCLISVWAMRLTWNWWQRLGKHWLRQGGLKHEDWRYLHFKAEYPNRIVYWILFSLGGFHLFPTLLTFLGCVPLWFVLGAESTGSSFTGWDWLGTMCMVTSIILETIADQQMDSFLAAKPKGVVCRTGLWKYSRHPK
jgi:steroid 5-alpha reductase family enzyme